MRLGLGARIAILNDIGSSSVRDVLVFWIDNPVGNNKGYYVVGADINSSGYPSWGSRKEIPNYFRGVGDETQGAGVVIRSIGNSDSRVVG